MSPTQDDLRHFKEINRQDHGAIHPFTGTHFEMLGWLRCTNPGAGFLVPRSYAVTEAGYAALSSGGPTEGHPK